MDKIRNMTTTNKKASEHKRIFTELLSAYMHKAKQYAARFENTASPGYLWGFTWWSLPPKMWRVAKALGFKKVDYDWQYGGHQIGDYSGSHVAQESALKELREKYPESILLQSISSSGRLD